MSKKLIRKGLAVSAAVVLIASGVAALPATAAVDDSRVSLLPKSSDQTRYSIPVDNVFDLTSTQSLAAAAGSGQLKFLVTDPDGLVTFDYLRTGLAANTIATAVNLSGSTITVASNVVTLAKTDVGKNMGVGDLLRISNLTAVGFNSGNPFSKVVRITTWTSDNSIQFELTHPNLATVAASAGSSVEVGNSNALDTYEVLSGLGSALPTTAVSGVTQPTRASDGSFVVNSGFNADATTSHDLRLVYTGDISKSYSVTVTAWIDENATGAEANTIQSTEDSSSTRTITFVPWASSGVSLDLTQPIAAGTAWNANVSFDSAINSSQITAGRLTVGLGFVIDGVIVPGSSGTTTSSGVFTGGVATEYFATKNHWRIGTGSGVAVQYNWPTGTDDQFRAGYSYAAGLRLDGANYGSVVYKAIGDAVADAVGFVSSTRGPNILKVNDTTYKVRSGTGAFVATAKVTKSTVAVAGAPVTVTVTRSNLDSASTITVNGKTITKTSTDASVQYDSVTGADGTVSVTVSNSQAKTGDAVTVTVVHAGISSTATTYTWGIPTDANYKLTESSNVNNSIVNIAKGGSYSLNYLVADDFGSAPVENWRVKVTYTFLGAGKTQVVKSVPVTNGAASLSVTDDSATNGSYVVVADLQKLNSGTGNYDSLGAPVTLNTTVYVGSSNTAASVTVGAAAVTLGMAGAIDLEPAVFVNRDFRVDKNQAATGYVAGEKFNVAGIVTDANGVGIPGARVTITSNAGNLVAFTAGDVNTVGSITVTAGASGSYTVEARSHKAGNVLFTATSGSVSKTMSSTAPAVVRNSTTAADIVDVVFVAKESIRRGYSTPVALTVVDEWGNAVKVANGLNVSLSGRGYLSSYPTAVSASTGSATFTLVTGPDDRGPAIITVTADAGAGTADDVTVSRGIWVGPVANATAGVNKGVIVVDVYRAKGKTVTVSVAGRTVATFKSTKANFTYRVKGIAKGSKNVVVRIAGVRAGSATVSVK